jgi:hypothetical protein
LEEIKLASSLGDAIELAVRIAKELGDSSDNTK